MSGRRKGDPDLAAPRSPEWPPRWHDLAVAYGGPRALAAKLCVHYQTLWRWALKGAPVPTACANLIRFIAEEAKLPSPLDK